MQVRRQRIVYSLDNSPEERDFSVKISQLQNLHANFRRKINSKFVTPQHISYFEVAPFSKPHHRQSDYLRNKDQPTSFIPKPTKISTTDTPVRPFIDVPESSISLKRAPNITLETPQRIPKQVLFPRSLNNKNHKAATRLQPLNKKEQIGSVSILQNKLLPELQERAFKTVPEESTNLNIEEQTKKPSLDSNRILEQLNKIYEISKPQTDVTTKLRSSSHNRALPNAPRKSIVTNIEMYSDRLIPTPNFKQKFSHQQRQQTLEAEINRGRSRKRGPRILNTQIFGKEQLMNLNIVNRRTKPATHQDVRRHKTIEGAPAESVQYPTFYPNNTRAQMFKDTQTSIHHSKRIQTQDNQFL